MTHEKLLVTTNVVYEMSQGGIQRSGEDVKGCKKLL